MDDLSKNDSQYYVSEAKSREKLCNGSKVSNKYFKPSEINTWPLHIIESTSKRK